MRATFKTSFLSSLLVLGTACSGGVHDLSPSSGDGGAAASSSSTGDGGAAASSSSTSSSGDGGAAASSSSSGGGGATASSASTSSTGGGGAAVSSSSTSTGDGGATATSSSTSSSTGDGGAAVSSSSTSSSTGGAETCASPPPSRGNGAFTTAWAIAFGDGTSRSEGRVIAADASGNVTLVGDAYGPVDLGAGVSFFSNGRFLAKLDPEGNPLWASAPTVLPALVAVDTQGSIWTTTPDVSGVPHSIAKLGPDGEELWSKSLPGKVSALSPTGDGGVVLIIPFNSSIDYGGASFTVKGKAPGSDVFVLALDASGAVAWSTTIATPLAPPEDYMMLSNPDVAAMPSGGALVQALVVRGGLTPPLVTYERVVQRLGPNGEVLWARTFPVQGSSPVIQVVAAPDDGALLVARPGSAIANLGCDSLYRPGVLLQALDASGQLRWERVIDAIMGSTRPSFDAAGNLVLVGVVQGLIDLGGGDLLDGDTYAYRIFVARYAPDGAHLASQTYEGTPPPDAGWLTRGESRAVDSAVDPFGNVLLTGFYAGALDFGTGVLPDVPILDGPYTTRGLVVKLSP